MTDENKILAFASYAYNRGYNKDWFKDAEALAKWAELAGQTVAVQPAATFTRHNKGGSGEFVGVQWNMPFADIPDQGALFFGSAAKPVQEQDADDERESDEYVIDRMSKILAGVAIALKGEELPLHRHSYHDLAKEAQVTCLERDLLKVQVEELKAVIAAIHPAQPVAAQPATDMDALKTWPENIWLQGGEEEIEEYTGSTEDMTWCEDNINRGDVKYVRADLVTPPAQQESKDVSELSND